MNADDDTGDDVVTAYRRRREARAELTAALEGLSPLATESVISMIEAHGPAKTLEQLQTAPEEIGCYHVNLNTDEQRQRIAASLVKFAESGDAVDRAVGAREAVRPDRTSDERQFDFHGRLALVNTKEGTFLYLDTPQERHPLNMRPGDEAFPPGPTQRPTRRRSRGRSR
jgi:hypothetical protein